MAKSKKNDEKKLALKDAVLRKECMLKVHEKNYSIVHAVIKDHICNYHYEVLSGTGEGDTHKVEGTNIVKEEMFKVFEKFNVHFAALDDAFRLAGIEEDIDLLHEHEITLRYHVNGFKIKGGADDESIILMGHKYVVTAGGRIEFDIPRTPIDNTSSYKWYNELKQAADDARLEIALYKEGYSQKIDEEEEEEINLNQQSLFKQPGSIVTDGEFEKAIV